MSHLIELIAKTLDLVGCHSTKEQRIGRHIQEILAVVVYDIDALICGIGNASAARTKVSASP